ncbi:hypothetical protein RND71_001870 [Anisodus tanguticus]|uniref:ACT domain-containing protein n=1 Tax=Anisodus tanguticus TaxID=243964 RepID=A0AAE1SYS4_9SOLA|nr:hypothetical protein RND71_001870 [Anisodus tanguticus]
MKFGDCERILQDSTLGLFYFNYVSKALKSRPCENISKHSTTLIDFATREKIVAESTSSIKRLEGEVLRLENLKKSLLGELVVYKPALSQCRNRVSYVNVTVSKGLAFFGIQFQLSHGLMTKIFSVLDKHEAEVLAANISVSEHQLATLTITVTIGNNESNTIENIRRELLLF